MRSGIRIFLLLNLSIPLALRAGTVDSLLEKLQAPAIADTTRAQLSFEIARAYFDEYHFASALHYADQSERWFQEQNLPHRVARVQVFKGNIFAEANDYENAIANLTKANEVYESAQDSFPYFSTNLQLAEIHVKLGNFDKGVQLINGALQYFKQHDDSTSLKDVYYQLAILYGLQSELDSALIFLEKAKSLITSSPTIDDNELGGIYNNIGAIYSKKDSFRAALQSYHRAIDIFEKGGNKKGVGVSISNIAFLYHKFDSLDLADRYYRESSEILKEMGDIFYLSTIYSNWSDLYAERGNYEKAYEMQLNYQALEDSISGVEVMTRIAEMEKQFELKKKNRELEYLEIENRVKRNQQYLLIAVMVLIIVVAFLIYRNLRIRVKNTRLKAQVLRSEKQLLKEELQFKGKEVEDMALRIIEKNRFLESLKDEVGKIDGVGENKEKIKSVSTHIRENLYIDQDRKDFELQLDEIHKSFLFKLDKKYPDLTKSEKRLATLLVMDMSTKDIASILNLSIAGVKTSRYRLRKKIQLDSEIDLATHFQSI